MAYDDWGSVFCLSYAFGCHKSGLVTQHHNKVKDVFGNLTALAFKNVIRQPIKHKGIVIMFLL